MEEYEKVTLDKFTVVGISIRTTNQNNQSQKDISELWGRFIVENVIESIHNKISGEIYCIYTDYESDFMGEYTTILGCMVSDVDNIPEGLIVKEIPACDYYKFTSEGKLPEAVGETWGFIWQSDFDRKYIADFEIYGAAAQNPDNAIVTTYLSIK